METLRWGILSTAGIGIRQVIGSIRAARRCEVVAIASREANRAMFAAQRLGIPRSYGSYRALLADPGVDAVYIPLPNHLHAEWAVAALDAGKHVLCEKPIAPTAGEARKMGAAAAGAGRLLVEAFMYRHHPTWVTVRRLVGEGRIGELRAVRSWFSYFNDDPGDIRNVAAYGGGALLDVGCYCIDLSRMLCAGEPTRVSAAITRDPVSGVDVITTAILEFGERVASFGVSTRAAADQRVDVYGSEGRLALEIPFNIPADGPTRVLLWGRGGRPTDPPEVLPFPPADAYTLQAEAFAAAVLDGAPAPVPFAGSIANMEAIERVLAAAG